MPAVVLNSAQQVAVDEVRAGLGAFGVYLLDGVTGSGKTEVYLSLIEEVIAAGRQALVLIPEIGLSPQLVARFQKPSRRFARGAAFRPRRPAAIAELDGGA